MILKGIQNIKDISSEILELFRDAVIIVDKNGIIQYLNSYAIELFGYERMELMGVNVEILIPQFLDDHGTQGVNKSQKSAHLLSTERQELFGRRKDKVEFPIEISSGPVTKDDETFLVAIVRDITFRNDKKLRELKKREFEKFAYVASHDLQEPLRTIMTFTDLLRQEYTGQLDEKADTFLNFISQASNRMSLQIKGMLDHSRIGQNRKRTKVDCAILLEQVRGELSAIISESNAIIEIGELPEINGYETELRLLFQHLIENAIKFRKASIAPEMTITAQKENEYWKFSFKDNGVGISAEHTQRIFDLFQRLHSSNEYPGIGVGLAHCQKVVDLHGGQIWVESELEEGSTFHISLPI